MPRSARRPLLLLLTALLLTTTAVLLPARAAHAEGVSDWLTWVNQVPAANGLGWLQLDDEQSALAQQRAAINAGNGSLAHTPDLRAGVTAGWSKLGENVGMGMGVADIGTAFRNSPKHLANLLDRRYTHIGIGVVYQGGQMYVAHRFLSVASPAPAPAPAPAPKPRSTPPTTPPTAAAPVTPPPLPAAVPPPAEPQRVATVLDALRQRG